MEGAAIGAGGPLLLASFLLARVSTLDPPAGAAGIVQARRSAVVVYAASRPLWQPGVTPPAHLDGTLPGDFGFGEPRGTGSNQLGMPWQAARWLDALTASCSTSCPADPLNLGVNKEALDW